MMSWIDLHRPFHVALLAGLLAASLAGAGCRSNPNRDLQTDPDRAYEIAKKRLDGGDYQRAIQMYEQLEARFPFSKAARQGQLDLMYAYYRNREPESAVDQAEQFIRENPTHPRVDYAYYIQGLVYFERNPNFLERWLRADLSERPPIDARRSFQSFQTLLRQYPNSEYAEDSRQRMIFLRNRLANYEVHVAQFYLDRKAYVGAINRAKYAIENYDGAPAIAEALEIMAESYDKLGMPRLAENARTVLHENRPVDQSRDDRRSHWWEFW